MGLFCVLLQKRQRKGIAGGVFGGMLVKVQVGSDPGDSNSKSSREIPRNPNFFSGASPLEFQIILEPMQTSLIVEIIDKSIDIRSRLRIM